MLKKILMFLLATNVVACRPTKHRPTGMPTACANYVIVVALLVVTGHI